MSIQRKNPLPVLAVGCGLAGGLLRGMEYKTGFELGTGLAIRGNIYALVLTALLVLAAAGCLLLCRGLGSRKDFERSFCGKDGLSTGLGMAGGFGMALVGFGWLYLTVTQGLEAATRTFFTYLLEYPYGLLSVICGGAIILLTVVQDKGQLDENRAVLTLLPMFYGSFALLVTYRIYCVSANLDRFVPELLAEVCAVAAFYLFAGFLYSKPHPVLFGFFAAMGVALGLTESIGSGLNLMLGGASVVPSMKALCRVAGILMAALFLLAELQRFCGAQRGTEQG